MRKIAIAAATASVLVAGCSTGPNGGPPAEGVGALTGAVAGGVIGSRFGGGAGKVVAATLGAAAGGLIGSQIGRSIDERDRQIAMDAEYRALEYGRAGRPENWRNEATGTYGEVVVGPGYTVNALDCRDYTHSVYIDGRPQVARGTACRQPDGSWRVVS
ncbi:glycine zipper 2TM domain-containing protein [Propylenella binzhouense]|uniref:17 kDa surface antigen n=1 Tax=Propylenella binzhouense TaxID=2555902 RepID=A0A964T980_9HYPH|nr:glycine zipper 2TM domain-containing protein [Propylenella binzhouense]MYZ50395.1 glycine zipper 2TM domain-containing protein [Propylenella binzhouense]